MNETTPVSSILKRIAPIQLAAWRLMMEKHQDFMQQFEIGFRDRHNLTLNVGLRYNGAFSNLYKEVPLASGGVYQQRTRNGAFQLYATYSFN